MPPKKQPIPDPDAGLDEIPVSSPRDFVRGATSALKRDEAYPWEAPNVRRDLRVNTSTKLPEDLLLMLEWVAQETGGYKQDIIQEALEARLQDELHRLGVDVKPEWFSERIPPQVPRGLRRARR